MGNCNQVAQTNEAGTKVISVNMRYSLHFYNAKLNCCFSQFRWCQNHKLESFSTVVFLMAYSCNIGNIKDYCTIVCFLKEKAATVDADSNLLLILTMLLSKYLGQFHGIGYIYFHHVFPFWILQSVMRTETFWCLFVFGPAVWAVHRVPSTLFVPPWMHFCWPVLQVLSNNMTIGLWCQKASLKQPHMIIVMMGAAKVICSFKGEFKENWTFLYMAWGIASGQRRLKKGPNCTQACFDFAWWALYFYLPTALLNMTYVAHVNMNRCFKKSLF